MKNQVGKSDVFTKESLRKLQDKMRVLCIESFNKEYGLINSLTSKEKLSSFLDSVSKTNKEYKKVQTLSVTLNNVDTKIKENHEKIKTLTKNNEALTLRGKTLTKNIKNKDKKIEELKEENHSLKNTLKFWKDKFLRVMSLIKDKLFDKEKERENYFDVSKDLYKKGIIKEDTFNELNDKYNFSKEHDNKGKDDFEIEI